MSCGESHAWLLSRCSTIRQLMDLEHDQGAECDKTSPLTACKRSQPSSNPSGAPQMAFMYKSTDYWDRLERQSRVVQPGSEVVRSHGHASNSEPGTVWSV